VQLLAATAASDPPGEPPSGEPATPRTRWWLSSATIAIVAWLIALPVALLIPRVAGLNPISVRGAIMPIVALAIGIALAAVVLLRGKAAEAVVGAMAGLYAAWFVLLGRAMLYGTAFGYEGMEGDAKRVIAMAMRYTTTWASADATVPDRPALYPPLFPWLVGRASAATGVAPYHVVAFAQVLFISFAVLAAFLLWRRLVPSVVALAITAAALLGYNAPDKPYEVLALIVTVPWILLTFTKPPRGRMHWLPAGVIGGLLVLTYQGFLVFAAIGTLWLIWRTWRSSGQRWAEVRRLAYIAGTALVVSSWYVLPYAYSIFFLPGGAGVWESYESLTYVSHPVPLNILQTTPSTLLLLVGLVGMVWWSRTHWWARSLGILLLGTYAFYILAVVRFVLTTNNMFAHYSIRLVGEILAVAGVLTLAECVRLLVRNFDAVKVRTTTIVLGCVFAFVVSYGYWGYWKPTTVGGSHNPRVNLQVVDLNPADAPLTQPLPDGRLPEFAAKDAGKWWLPVWQIRDEVAARYGAGYLPEVVTQDERLFAYLPWYSAALPAKPVPADVVADAKAGKIDAFVLKADVPGGGWRWHSTVFEPAMFDSSAFDVIHLENDFVLVIRKP